MKVGSKAINFPDKKLSDWQESLAEYARQYGAIYAVSDTETTGVLIIDKKTNKFNRLLEWSICFAYECNGFLKPCLDSQGEAIVIDEPINPFVHSSPPKPKQKLSVHTVPPDSTDVHGITDDFLFGNDEGEKGRPKLEYCAPNFSTVYDCVRSLFSEPVLKSGDIPIILVFHKAKFDIGFLNHECETWELPLIESIFGVVDTLKLAEKVFRKAELNGSYSLDSLYEYGKEKYPELINHIDRPIHSALIDSMILLDVYNIIKAKHIGFSSEKE